MEFHVSKTHLELHVTEWSGLVFEGLRPQSRVLWVLGVLWWASSEGSLAAASEVEVTRVTRGSEHHG